jgi:flagellar biosynthesis protein FlhF
MRLKSFFAGDVASALSQARLELGPEAVLVHSRRTPPEAKHLGEFEVVVGTAPAGMPAEPPPPVAAVAAPASDGLALLSSEVASVRRQMETLAAVVRRSHILVSERNGRPELSDLFAGLIENEVDPELAHQAVAAVRALDPPADGAELDRAIREELARRFRVEPRLGKGERPTVAALVGPCGAGKTTTLVKLAVVHGLTARRPTQVLSMDTSRVAASEQLRSFAGILGVGFQALETTRALAQALEEHRNKDFIFIDTPGFGPRDMEDAAELAEFLAGRPDIDVHLALTASMKSADLSRVVDRFEIFRPRKLLFTRLDETEAFGPLFNEPARTGKPLSFLTAGQRIPEDLEPASEQRVLDLVMRRQGGDTPVGKVLGTGVAQ